MKTALLFLILSGCLACSSNIEKQQKKISIVLDVFSGRPNPSWELSTSESGELLKQLSSLPEADKNKSDFFDGLGYRGLIISVYDELNPSSPPVIYRIYKGFVLMNDKVFPDLNFVENKLLTQARNKGFSGLIDRIENEE
jgi:hypothetical protein